MNRYDIQGQWEQVKGEAKKRWGDLTDDDLARAEGDSDRLIGALRERYGYSKDQAQREVDEWVDGLVKDIKPDR